MTATHFQPDGRNQHKGRDPGVDRQKPRATEHVPQVLPGMPRRAVVPIDGRSIRNLGQKNRRFNTGKQFRRLPVYSFRVCRKISEVLPGKNATVPDSTNQHTGKKHGTASRGGHKRTAGGQKARAA